MNTCFKENNMLKYVEQFFKNSSIKMFLLDKPNLLSFIPIEDLSRYPLVPGGVYAPGGLPS